MSFSDAPNDASPIAYATSAKLALASMGTWPKTSWHTSGSGVYIGLLPCRTYCKKSQKETNECLPMFSDQLVSWEVSLLPFSPPLGRGAIPTIHAPQSPLFSQTDIEADVRSSLTLPPSTTIFPFTLMTCPTEQPNHPILPAWNGST